MAWRLDARIGLHLAADGPALARALAEGPPAALLHPEPVPPGLPPGVVAVQGFVPVAPHRPGCGCCGGRPSVAVALDLLFQARLRNRCAWFDRVVALAGTEEVRAMLHQALAEDAVTAARFRLG